MYILPAWKEAPVYTEAEKAVLNVTDVLTRIPDSQPEVITNAYERMTAHYSKGEIANIVMAICQMNS